jgi:tetratricopeptide (TPR) repeat protein
MNERYFLTVLLAFIITAILVGGAFIFYQNGEPTPRISTNDQFLSVYNQLAISALPAAVERQLPIHSRLEQLKREPCYRDAIAGLSDALLEAGFPRESAASLVSFANRCPGSDYLLAGAYQAMMTISDSSRAFRVADRLVNQFPAQSRYRYWRAKAYDDMKEFPRALSDYINAVQLVGDLQSVSGDAFYNISRMYAALGRYCEAITPIETYISFDPAERRTPQTTTIIAEYAEKGNCDPRFARGVARVPFVGTTGVHTLPVSVNGVIGNFILDTGATYVSVTSAFAEKSKVSIDTGNQIIMKTVGGASKADIGHAGEAPLTAEEMKAHAGWTFLSECSDRSR